MWNYFNELFELKWFFPEIFCYLPNAMGRPLWNLWHMIKNTDHSSMRQIDGGSSCDGMKSRTTSNRITKTLNKLKKWLIRISLMTPLPLLSVLTRRCHHLLMARGMPKMREATKTAAKVVRYPHNWCMEWYVDSCALASSRDIFLWLVFTPQQEALEIGRFP